MQQDCDSKPATVPERCLTLFDLLPTSPPHHWLIAADWIEEHGRESDQAAAQAFRDGIWVTDPKTGDGYGNGDGYGDGNGYGYGDGDGNGNGDGYGNGYGDGLEVAS